MHGIDHFLFYTFDDTAEEVMDIYRPYLDAGVATRVHMEIPDRFDRHWTFEADDKSRFNSGWTTNDCLYRTKNHAKWLLPTIDVDEFIRTNSSIKDVLTELMDGRLATVRSVNFRRYIFLRPQGTDSLLISSAMREAQTQSFSKFVVNPAAVNALFVHWPTSWDEGAVEVTVPPETAVIEHFRTINETTTTFNDPVLVAEAAALQQALESRFKMTWRDLWAKLAKPSNLPPAPRIPQSVPAKVLAPAPAAASL